MSEARIVPPSEYPQALVNRASLQVVLDSTDKALHLYQVGNGFNLWNADVTPTLIAVST